jgi:hypothetical protein
MFRLRCSGYVRVSLDLELPNCTDCLFVEYALFLDLRKSFYVGSPQEMSHAAYYQVKIRCKIIWMCLKLVKYRLL